jgi:DNA-binding response OmpR family regulator
MISGKLILTVGDDEILRQILVEQLQLKGEFRIKEALTGKEALQYTETQCFDGVLMDVELIDFNAYEICCQMRKNGVKAPIIIISDANNDQDTILGLDSGANDFVVKPIKIAVLLARLRAHIRQYEQNEHAVLNFGTRSE